MVAGIALIPATDEDSKQPDKIRKRVEHHLKPLVDYAEDTIIDYVGAAICHDAQHKAKKSDLGCCGPSCEIRRIPVKFRAACRINRRTSLFIGGTGGMRKLETGHRSRLHKGIEDFLVNPRRFLRMKYHTIPGIAEGIYGWVAANYAASTEDTDAKFGTNPIKGYVEMGGQTMQIALSCGTVPNQALRGDGFRDITIGSNKYNVFAHEWGDRGADAQWRRHLLNLYGVPNPADKIAKERLNPLVKDGCLPDGAWDPNYPNGYSGSGEFDECVKECKKLVACGDECAQAHGCLMQTVRQDVRTKVAGVKAWVGGATFWYGARGVFADPDTGSEYQPIRLMHEANWVHKMFEQRRNVMPGGNQTHAWRSVFNAVYTTVTLHKGFGIRLEQGSGGDASTDIDLSAEQKLAGEMVTELEEFTTTDNDDHTSTYTIVDPDKQPWALGAALIQVHDPNCIQDLLERYKPSL